MTLLRNGVFLLLLVGCGTEVDRPQYLYRIKALYYQSGEKAVVGAVNPDSIVEYRYDGLGRVIQSATFRMDGGYRTDLLSSREFEFDADGQLVRVTYAQATTEVGEVDHVVLYAEYREGLLVSLRETGIGGARIFYGYDADGNATEVRIGSQAISVHEDTTWDLQEEYTFAEGRLVSGIQTDKLLHGIRNTFAYKYDEAGFLERIVQTDANGATVEAVPEYEKGACAEAIPAVVRSFCTFAEPDEAPEEIYILQE